MAVLDLIRNSEPFLRFVAEWEHGLPALALADLTAAPGGDDFDRSRQLLADLRYTASPGAPDRRRASRRRLATPDLSVQHADEWDRGRARHQVNENRFCIFMSRGMSPRTRTLPCMNACIGFNSRLMMDT